MAGPEIRGELVAFGRRLHERGFVAATDGNLSVRLPGGGFLATPTGLPKAELREDLLALLNEEGKPAGGKPPSSEWPLHLAIYRSRPDVGAVVHAHPPFATTLACLGRTLDRPLLSEAVMALGPVALVPFELPSTAELARRAAEALGGEGKALLLANHGAVTVGEDLRTAFYRMESLEHTARITYYAGLSGGGEPLPAEAVRALTRLGKEYRLARPEEAPCPGCPLVQGTPRFSLGEEELVRLLTDFLRFRSGEPRG